MPSQKLLGQSLLDQLSGEAEASPRLRKHRNFHPDDAYPAHRLLVAIEPGSYVPPHCHLDPAKDETLLVIRGKLGVLFFDAAGEITAQHVLTPGGAVFGVDIPHGVFHTVLALTPGTAFFEAKAGPYVPVGVGELPGWAPREGDPAFAGYRDALIRRFVGA